MAQSPNPENDSTESKSQDDEETSIAQSPNSENDSVCVWFGGG